MRDKTHEMGGDQIDVRLDDMLAREADVAICCPPERVCQSEPQESCCLKSRYRAKPSQQHSVQFQCLVHTLSGDCRKAGEALASIYKVLTYYRIG